jgi:hypothetical protein
VRFKAQLPNACRQSDVTHSGKQLGLPSLAPRRCQAMYTQPLSVSRDLHHFSTLRLMGLGGSAGSRLDSSW